MQNPEYCKLFVGESPAPCARKAKLQEQALGKSGDLSAVAQESVSLVPARHLAEDMASMFSSLSGFGGPIPTPDPTADLTTTDYAATYASTGDRHRVSGHSPGRIGVGMPGVGQLDGEDGSGFGEKLEVAYSAAQKLAAASSSSLEPLGEGE